MGQGSTCPVSKRWSNKYTAEKYKVDTKLSKKQGPLFILPYSVLTVVAKSLQYSVLFMNSTILAVNFSPLDTCMAVKTQFTTAQPNRQPCCIVGTQKRSPFSHYFLLILHEESVFSNGNELGSARVTTSGRRTVVKVKCAINSRNVPSLRPCPTCNAVLTSALTPRIPRTVYRYFWAYLFFTF